MTLHKVEGKVYFEIPMKYLEREMLLASTISEASDNNLCAIGYKPKDRCTLNSRKRIVLFSCVR